jgi:hypothetical protein
MKMLMPILGLVWLTLSTASAQVTVEIMLDQDQFLPGESLPLAVKITNQSGESLHLGAETNWLTFSVESADNFIVAKNAEVPVLGEFDLDSSKLAIKRVDLEPYFVLSRPGRYHVTATLQIKGWNPAVASPVKSFDVISGVKLWSQDYGMPTPGGVTNNTPEIRKFTLEKAALEDPKFQNSPLRMYVQVSDETEARVFKVVPVGKMVGFSEPEAQLDRYSSLHVLWQSGASIFTYVVVSPDGGLLRQDIYDYVGTRPRLDLNSAGEVVVAGGVLRARPLDLPTVLTPDELPAPAKP